MTKLATSADAIEDRIRGIAQSVIADGTFVVDIIVRGRQGSRVVEVFLDSDTGLGVDELARYSREIGFLLEAEELVKGRYRLNVSSPGADRPIRMLRQLVKHTGRTLAVKMDDGSTVQGVLKEAKNDQVVLTQKSGDVTLDFKRIEEAQVVLPW